MVPAAMAPNKVPRLGKWPEDVSCQNCGAEVRTEVKKELSQWFGWIWVIFLAFVASPCCWIPCVLDGFHDFTHRCPNCNAIIGKSTPDDREEEKNKGIKTVGITVLVTCLVLINLSIICMFIMQLIWYGRKI